MKKKHKKFIKESLDPTYKLRCDKCHEIDVVTNRGVKHSLEYFIEKGWNANDDGDVICPKCSNCL